MISTKKIVSIGMILVLMGAIIIFTNRKSDSVGVQETFGEVATSTEQTTQAERLPKIETQGNSVVSQKSTLTAQDGWNVFQKYIQAAGNRNIGALKELSYSLSATCNNPKLENECFMLMDGVYTVAKNLVQSEYKNFAYDSKQAVLYTDARIESTETKTALVRGYIYFGRDDQGNLKLFAIDPSRGSSINTGTSTRAELEKKLNELSVDTDKDTVPDFQELCTDSTGKDVAGCTKTDPLKKDTLGDGWWDGVRVFLR